ncbi:helix-turn-helix domain-containing protein [Streptomyces sp. NBC_00648]|uniref:MmyB family transcriptional regulator n=1 Tax=Streptomyces sp. NBC_00648 TaxID=2975797 RepID=UPI0032558F9F
MNEGPVLPLAARDRMSLKTLLQERRAAIHPESAGFPPRQAGPGRRVAGLSQEQMDILLERTPGTYNRFENGQLNPTAEFLTNVARTLRLNEQEWTFLWRLTRREYPPYTLHRDSGMSVPGVWQRVVEQIDGAMAYITDAAWNLLAHNAEFAALFPRGEVPANTMRWMTLDPEAREDVLTDWADRWAPMVLPQLRHGVEMRPNHVELRRLEAEVQDDPVAGPLYRETGATPIPYPDGSERPIRHSELGPGWVTTCVAEPVTSPGARVMLLLYTPGASLVSRHPVLSAPLTS